MVRIVSFVVLLAGATSICAAPTAAQCAPPTTTSSGSAPTGKPACFPYGSATLPTDLSKPNVSLADWWCPQSMAYGFQGFSYPLENSDCSDPSNSFSAMNADFARMKADFGATIVRMYYPTCTEASVFRNALQAAVANNMAIIFQVWTNFGDGVGRLFKSEM